MNEWTSPNLWDNLNEEMSHLTDTLHHRRQVWENITHPLPRPRGIAKQLYRFWMIGDEQAFKNLLRPWED